MNVLLKTHQELTEKDFTQLWENGLFVFDANVLLDLYRLPETAREDLINILSNKDFNKRIWLPFQVLLEFINNKLEAISDQKNKFNEVRKILQETIEKFNFSYDEMTKNLNKLQLGKRHSVINPDSYTNKELLKVPIKKLTKFILELEDLEKKQPDVNDKDSLQKKVLKIFADKIGNNFSKLELEEIYKEGESRYKDNIPPGYMDKTKEGFYIFEDKKFVRKYGDLVVWKEIINKAKTENIEYVVLITGDIKEDWWQEKRGKKLGARFELLNEIYFEANSVKIFHIYDTSSFMKYAKEYLNVEVKDESIKETKDLIDLFSYERKLPNKAIDSVLSILERALKVFNLTPFFTNEHNFDENLITSISPDTLYQIFTEILSNVNDFSSDKDLIIKFDETSEHRIITFINKIDWKRTSISREAKFQEGFRNSRGGLNSINKLLKIYNSYLYTSQTDELFETSLYFDRKRFAHRISAKIIPEF